MSAAIDLDFELDPAYVPKWRSPVVPWTFCDAARKQLLREAWGIGEITHHMTPSQYEVYQRFLVWQKRRDGGREYLMDISRRWGKSTVGCVWLISLAIQRPRARLIYVGPELKQIKRFVLPLMGNILSDCPPEMQPHFRRTDMIYEFPNSSRIELIGLDKNPDGARGNAIDGCFCDEAAFFRNLEYLLWSVLKPQMLGRPWARVMCASTPPVSPAHIWSEQMIPTAIKRGAHDIRTLEDADQYSTVEIEEMIAELGGREDSRCQREYFCRHVADANMAIVPEFRQVERAIVKEVAPPEHRDCYTAMDPGWADLTACLFGYWHFERAQLVVEDELAESRMNSGRLAALLKLKESQLWGNLKRNSSNGTQKSQPYRRYSDRDHRLLSDLSREHDLVFIRTLKDNPEQAVNALRVAVSSERIMIHPRCEKLIKHLRNGVWKNEQRAQFAWQGGEFGHFDCVAALIYMWRNINRNRNPAPRVVQTYSSDSYNPALAEANKKVSKWARQRNPLLR